jgi:hypothetical protein
MTSVLFFPLFIGNEFWQSVYGCAKENNGYNS